MLRRLVPLAAAFVIALSGGSYAASELALLSRTLIQGPAHAVAFSHDGNDVVVGTGCGIAILRGANGFRNPALSPARRAAARYDRAGSRGLRGDRGRRARGV